MKKLFVLATLVSLLATTPASAEMEKYTFDKLHTQIMFSVEHLGYSFSHGRFTEFGGGFSFDPENVEESNVNVTIQTDSITMDSEEWEKHLKNADFFNVEKYPTMTFKSTKIERTDDNTGVLTGDLTLLGKTRSVVLDVVWNKTDIHPYFKKKASGFSATGKLKRSDWGMNYGLPNVGDTVAINIQVEGLSESAPEETKAEEKPAVAPKTETKSEKTTETQEKQDAQNDTVETEPLTEPATTEKSAETPAETPTEPSADKPSDKKE